MIIRPWQKEAHDKALNFFSENQHAPFLIDAAPGSGKTKSACLIAKSLLDKKQIDRIIVVSPRAEIANQWAKEFYNTTGRELARVTGSEDKIEKLELDLSITWQAIKTLIPSLQKVCKKEKTLLICDEHHHAAAVKAWGQNAQSAFDKAKFMLILTGTWIRPDGEETIWFNDIEKNHPEAATYRITYGTAVELEYCRPVSFHRHQGRFTVTIDNGKINVSGHGEADNIPDDLKKLPGMKQALAFYTLARTPLYESDKKTPKKDSYQATMLQAGIEKLNEIRFRKPNAGGLIIAPNIKLAEYMAHLLGILDGEEPLIVHSKLGNPENKIKSFRNSNKKWLVSVAMVSEGIDIPRLRVLVYLPNSRTELSFRQALGRVVRNDGPLEQDVSALIIIPRYKEFEEFASRIEQEMPDRVKKDHETKTKKCHECFGENKLGANICVDCGFEFPVAPPKEEHSEEKEEFFIEFDEAMRQGAIVREMELEEYEVLEGEAMASDVRDKIKTSGNPALARLVRTIPEESWAILKKIFNEEKP